MDATQRSMTDLYRISCDYGSKAHVRANADGRVTISHHDITAGYCTTTLMPGGSRVTITEIGTKMMYDKDGNFIQ